MNLLIFDKEFETNHEDYIQPLTQNLKDFYAQTLTCLYEAINLYEKNSYEIVIVDFTTVEGKTFLDNILEHNPKQKVITLGYELTSSESSCDECQQNHNKRRLMKPVNPIDIYQTINDFDTTTCKYANYFNSPKLLLNEFIENYGCFDYDELNQLIVANKENHDYLIKEFVEILNELKKYEIEHTIFDEYCIKIS